MTMGKSRIYRLIIFSMLIVISIPAFSQSYINPQRKGAVSFGGKRLNNSNFTVGGVRTNKIQPSYGGQIVDERDLYNPHLESAFRSRGKPFVSHHPPPFSGNREISQGEQILIPQPLPYYQTPVNNSTVPSQEIGASSNSASEESKNLTPIIPAVVGTVDAMFRNSEKEESKTIPKRKHLSLDGWYGDIRTTGDNNGNFYVRNTNGEYISGNFYKSGNHINYNITHKGKEGSNSWKGDSYQQNSGGNLYLRSNQNLISGSTTSYGDTYRYRYSDINNKYEVELRDMGKTSQSIRVNENDKKRIYGYAN